MNSSGLLEKRKAPPSVPARLLSNWVEIFAIPVAAAIMEAQPILLGLELLRPYFLGGVETQIPGALSIILALLVMQWWAMFIQARGQGVLSRRGRPTLRTLGGVPVAALLICVLQPEALGDGVFIFLSLCLFIWSWYRGVMRANDPLSDEYLTGVFRVGFLVLLVVMAFAFLASLDTTNNNLLSTDLARSLPIFFLSSLIALSFTRIGRQKREQQRHPGSGEVTGRWLSGLTITWIVLVVVAVALEALPLDAIMAALNPLWLALSLLGQGILDLVGFVIYGVLMAIGFVISGIVWLLNLFFHFSQTKTVTQIQQAAQKTLPVIKKTGQQSPLLTILLAVAILLVALVIFFMIVRRKKRPETALAEEEEVREALNRDEVLRTRRGQRRKQTEVLALEALAPDSMRARYREFLQEMAAQGEETQRRASETPLEYQRRLLRIARLRHFMRDGQQEQDAELLNALTLAYARERYGGKQVASEQQSYLGSRVPQLARKFASNTPATARRPVSGWSAEKARWGED